MPRDFGIRSNAASSATRTPSSGQVADFLPYRFFEEALEFAHDAEILEQGGASFENPAAERAPIAFVAGDSHGPLDVALRIARDAFGKPHLSIHAGRVPSALELRRTSHDRRAHGEGFERG